jgi:hypothetical protein
MRLWEALLLREASRLLSAFEALAFEDLVTPTEVAQRLGVEDTDFVQAKLVQRTLPELPVEHRRAVNAVIQQLRARADERTSSS